MQRALMRRAILVVLDGLGIGAMPDTALVRPQDANANTLRSVLAGCADLTLPTLTWLGLGRASGIPRLEDLVSPAASFGRCMLYHQGADTFVGHQEIMGAKPEPSRSQFMDEVGPAIEAELGRQGLSVEHNDSAKPWLVVDGHVVVADNMEGEPGQNINVTASLSEVTFDHMRRVGTIVREVVAVSRVILVGAEGLTLGDILGHMVTRGRGTGVDTPGLGVYEKPFRVKHLGYSVDPGRQLPSIMANAGYPVCLIGKVADIVECEGAALFPDIPTSDVFDRLLECMSTSKKGLIAVNVQETDLAGHLEDPLRYAKVLRKVDQGLGRVIARLDSDDILMIVADHGNDPSIGHSKHTREYTPLLVYSPSLNGTTLGVRATLADSGATVAESLGVDLPEFGESFLPQLLGAQARGTIKNLGPVLD